MKPKNGLTEALEGLLMPIERVGSGLV
jgi:hypothetical protein